MLSHPGHPQGDQGLQPHATRDNPRPARWPSAPRPTPAHRWAVVAAGDPGGVVPTGRRPVQQPQGLCHR